MSGSVSTNELDAALKLNDDLKLKINNYEQGHWAANLSTPEMKTSWSHFIKKLGVAIKKDKLDDDQLVQLMHFISTMDTVLLLDELRKLDKTRQTRFLDLLNWISVESPEESQRANASTVKERILMAYRLSMYPEVYSLSRLARATQLITSSF